MAEQLKFELVAPERLVFEGDVTSVTVPGSEGDFTVFSGHAPVLATIRPGVVVITAENGDEERMFVRGGFAEATVSGLTVLAEQAIAMSDLSAEALAEQVTNAKDDVADAKDDQARARAQEELDHLEQLQSAL